MQAAAMKNPLVARRLFNRKQSGQIPVYEIEVGMPQRCGVSTNLTSVKYIIPNFFCLSLPHPGPLVSEFPSNLVCE